MFWNDTSIMKMYAGGFGSLPSCECVSVCVCVCVCVCVGVCVWEVCVECACECVQCVWCGWGCMVHVQGVCTNSCAALAIL